MKSIKPMWTDLATGMSRHEVLGPNLFGWRLVILVLRLPRPHRRNSFLSS